MLYSSILSYGRIKVQLNFDWYQLEVCGFNSSISIEFYGEDLNIKHRVERGPDLHNHMWGYTWSRSKGAGTTSVARKPSALTCLTRFRSSGSWQRTNRQRSSDDSTIMRSTALDNILRYGNAFFFRTKFTQL